MRALLALMAALLLACAGAGQAAAPTFAAVTPGRALAFPADFGAHPAFRTEWWYVTGWLATPDGKPLGFQLTFFRSATASDRANPSAFAPAQLIIGHAALSDPALGKLVHDQRTAREGFGLAYAQTGNTDVKLDDWRMLRAADGSYRISVKSPQLSLDLQLAPTQAVMAQGEAGYSRKGPQATHASYYYSEPQLRVGGRVGVKGRSENVSGVAWLDHEWSSELLAADASGWDWLGANLDDGGALMAFRIRGKDGATLWSSATVRSKDGRPETIDARRVAFMPVRTWKSPRTGTTYPVAMDVRVGERSWRVEPLMDDQELDARASTGTLYWEGAVRIRSPAGAAGRGYLELTGYAEPLPFK